MDLIDDSYCIRPRKRLKATSRKQLLRRRSSSLSNAEIGPHIRRTSPNDFARV